MFTTYMHLYVPMCHNDQYYEKLSCGSAVRDKELYSLCWTVDEQGWLNVQGHELYVETSSLLDLLNDIHGDIIKGFTCPLSALKRPLMARNPHVCD